MYICIYIYIYMNLHIYIYLHMCIHTHIYVYIYIRLHMYLRTESASLVGCRASGEGCAWPNPKEEARTAWRVEHLSQNTCPHLRRRPSCSCHLIRLSVYDRCSGSAKIAAAFILSVVLKQHLVQVGRIDGPTEYVS